MLNNYLDTITHIHNLFELWLKEEEKLKHMPWSAQERRPVWKQKQKFYEEAKEAFRDIIRDWLNKNNLKDTFINLAFYFRSYSKIYDGIVLKSWITIPRISIYNSHGSIGKKARWMNKITVLKDRSIHVARTDSRFLEPLATDFVKFATALRDAVELENKT